MAGGRVACIVPAVGVICGFALCAAVSAGAESEVVVYTSVDEVPAREILGEFEESTGIRVRPVFDTEAAKTTGLALRLASEMNRPRADVFWNNELSRTLQLAAKGVLEAYSSPSAADVPSQWKDASGMWAAFALRARVIVYNSDRVEAGKAPRSLEDLCRPEWKGRVGIADPRFGTTATHVAALMSVWGEDKTIAFFRKLAGNGARVYQGNSLVRDAAASGEILAGLTDTDDVLLGMARGMKIGYVIPDQQANGIGAFVIPNSVARVKGGPNPDEAMRLIDFLLSRRTQRLAARPDEGWVPVRVKGDSDELVKAFEDLRAMEVDWKSISELTGPAGEKAARVLVK